MNQAAPRDDCCNYCFLLLFFFLEGRGCCDSLTSWSLPGISYVRGPSVPISSYISMYYVCRDNFLASTG